MINGKTKNRKHLSMRAKGMARIYRECAGAPSVALVAALAALEAGLYLGDLVSFGQLFGQSMGDGAGTLLAAVLSALFPVVGYVVFRIKPDLVSDARKRKAMVAALAAGTLALAAVSIALRFALLAYSADDHAAGPWALNAVAYSMPVVASILGAAAASLVLNDPVTRAKVNLAKLGVAIAEREAELRAHECNDPRVLRQRVLRVYRQAELQAESMYKASVASCLPAVSAGHGLEALDRVRGPLQPVIEGAEGAPDGRMPFGAFGEPEDACADDAARRPAEKPAA